MISHRRHNWKPLLCAPSSEWLKKSHLRMCCRNHYTWMAVLPYVSSSEQLDDLLENTISHNTYTCMVVPWYEWECVWSDYTCVWISFHNVHIDEVSLHCVSTCVSLNSQDFEIFYCIMSIHIHSVWDAPPLRVVSNDLTCRILSHTVYTSTWSYCYPYISNGVLSDNFPCWSTFHKHCTDE